MDDFIQGLALSSHCLREVNVKLLLHYMTTLPQYITYKETCDQD